MYTIFVSIWKENRGRHAPNWFNQIIFKRKRKKEVVKHLIQIFPSGYSYPTRWFLDFLFFPWELQDSLMAEKKR